MNVIVIDSEAYEQLKAELFIVVKKALKEVELQNASAQKSDWISKSEAIKILHYSSRTSWQKLRDSGEISWSKMGRQIVYSRSSIEKYIAKNRMV